ncbi:ShTK domain protein [Aphelenchoides fujianensis]|nr:ShTK domain protein [Aphelenchoides fujianensis]
MSDRLRFSRLRANANARFLCELLMIFLLLRSCHASVQPFLTAADFERAAADEEVTHLTEGGLSECGEVQRSLDREEVEEVVHLRDIRNTIIHELLHASGFYHEHERWDREAYDQFGRVDLSESSYLGEPYDYRSILHYDSLAFSKNGKETVIARAPGMTSVIGSALDFSPSDLVKIKRMYACGMPTEPIVPTADHFAQYQNYGLTPVSSPWSPLSSTLPLGNHVLEQPALPLPAFPRAQPEAPSTTEATTAGRCHSPFFEKIMREFCAQSCGFCTPQPSRTWRAYSEGHQGAQGYSLPVYQVPYAFG